MMITEGPKKHFWNYFLAIESDIENLSRYVEFSIENLTTYSIEMAQIMLTASSEVDVILKEIFRLTDIYLEKTNMYYYRKAIVDYFPGMIDEEIYIRRSALSFKPWENLGSDKQPDWWGGYNAVKHQRNDFFHEANLHNTLNAIGGLLIVLMYYYKQVYENSTGEKQEFKNITRRLQSNLNFVRMNPGYYHAFMVC